MSHDRTRPDSKANCEREKRTDRGKNHSRGLPGKIQRAETTAPDGVERDLINQVGYIAHKRGVDPADVWEEQD